jgi:hypothetical protein
MSRLLDALRDQINEQIINVSIDCPSRWAEKRRIMGAPFPGPYTFDKFPWCRELHDSKASWNVSMKSARAGFTEVGINLALYYIDVRRENVLYVLPTLGDSSDFAKSRFNPALRSRYLKDVFTSANNDRLKMAGDTALYIRGSRGDSGLKSIGAAIVILDELDEMDKSQIELVMHRLRGEPEKRVWFISTPTTPDHGVSVEYNLSTQEHYMFKCPFCGKTDQFRFPDSIQICGEGINDPDVHRSLFQCSMCKHPYRHFFEDGRLNQDEKLAALRPGFWHPTVKAVDDDRRGFKINQLYSYTVSPAEIAVDYFKAKISSHANQEFHKSTLGEPFVEEQYAVTDALIGRAKREYHCKELVPRSRKETRMITMGVDRGATGYYVVAEWFYPPDVIDLNESARCKVLDAGYFMEDDFILYCSRLMGEWQVRGCMIDADPGPTEGRRFARKFPGFVWLNRYRDGRVGKQMTIDDDGSYAPMSTVDRTSWFDLCMSRFFNSTIELPMDLPADFATHCKNLVRVHDVDKNGNPFALYKNHGADHFAHALNYAEMALPLAAAFAVGCDVNRFL